MLEEGGDTVAPPPRKKSATSLLPDKPVLATMGRPRRSDQVTESRSVSRSHSRAASVVTSETAGTDEDADVDEDHTADEEDEEDTSDEEEGVINHEEQAEEHGDKIKEPSEVQDVDDDGDPEDEDDENKAKRNVFESDDVDMTLRSPSPELQGSSRTEGGLFRGRAAGIAPNIADIEMGDATGDADDDLASLMGRVHLFTTRDPTAKPYLTMKHRVTPNLEPILTQLGINYSPIKSMC